MRKYSNFGNSFSKQNKKMAAIKLKANIIKVKYYVIVI